MSEPLTAAGAALVSERRSITHGDGRQHLDGDHCPHCHDVTRVIERAPGYGAYVYLGASAVHVHGCPLTRMGQKHGPCTCGAVEIWERHREAMLAIVHPTPALTVERLAEAAARAVDEALSVERVAEALIFLTPTKDHGQLCPVWVRRAEVLSKAPQSHAQRRGPIVCDCFVRRGAPMAAAALLAHLRGPRDG